MCNPGDLTWSALDRFGNVTVHERTPRAELRERLADADIAIANKVVWDEEALSWAPRLKLVALASTGYNVVDLNAARAHGVTVCNVPITPHIAWATREARARLLDEIAKNIGAFLAGTPRNVVS